MFCSTSSSSMRWKDWKIKPIFCLRKMVRLFSVIEKRSSPSRYTFPPVGASSPPMQFRRVLLPEPDSPTTAANSPRSMEKETSRRARTAASPFPYVLLRFSTRKSSIVFVLLIRRRPGRLLPFTVDILLP